MKYVKRMNIVGLKKFEKFIIEFNNDMNIIIGENESGKSTILEALNIVISQKYKNYDKYIVKDLLNKNSILNFERNPKLENIPTILIDVELDLDDIPSNGIYYGMNHGFEKNKMLYGIRFKCQIPDDIIDELLPVIEMGQIPYEYYQMTWNTFQGEMYNILKRPVNVLLIDNDDIDSSSSYNYYNKSLFMNSHDNSQQVRIKNDFREKLNGIFYDLPLNTVNEHQRFGINERKIIFENIITILDDDIQIENKGKGKENIIKTKIALDKNAGKNDVLAIEEPENHLSFSNLKQMISEIKNQTDKQMIITTHESMIASSLNLNKILWIKDGTAASLKSIPSDDSDFFVKNSNNNMLQYILSPKVIFVEGPTEYLLLPKIFEKLYNTTFEKERITIIECGGIKYKRYFNIATETGKKVAVLTDNDGEPAKIAYKNNYNKLSRHIKIFMDDSLKNWTWEACFYNLNKEKFEKFITINDNYSYYYHGKDYGSKVLGKMLNNKVEIAYLMYKSEYDFEIPEYIKECLKWIKE